VGQRESTDDDVDVLVRQRQLAQVALAKLGAGDLCRSDRQHLGGTVNADHSVAEGGKVFGVAAGAAGGVQRGTGRQAIQDLPDDGLLQVDELVSRQVIGFGPGIVALHDRDRPDSSSAAQLIG
jgi:hypothetical protein